MLDKQKSGGKNSLRPYFLTDFEQIHRYARIIERSAARNYFDRCGSVRHRKDDRGGLRARLVRRREDVACRRAVQRRAVQGELQEVGLGQLRVGKRCGRPVIRRKVGPRVADRKLCGFVRMRNRRAVLQRGSVEYNCRIVRYLLRGRGVCRQRFQRRVRARCARRACRTRCACRAGSAIYLCTTLGFVLC